MTDWTIEQSTAHVERDILTGMIVSDKVEKALSPVISPQDFSSPFTQMVCKWCLDHYKEYGQAPGRHIGTIFEEQKRNGLDPDLANLTESFLAGISHEFEQTEFNPDFVIVTAKKYLQERSLEKLKNELIDKRPMAVERHLDREARLVGTILKRGYKAEELLNANIPEPNWLVPGLLAEGFSLMAGRMKFGKTHLLRCLALSVATGRLFMDAYQVGRGDVLFLDLEEPEGQSRKKLNQIMEAQNIAQDELDGHLTIHPRGSWPMMDKGGLQMLRNFARENPGLRLVIIDTWKLFTPMRKGKDQFNYDLDYSDVNPIKTLAEEFHLSIMATYHLNKGWASYDSPFDAIYGSTGITAAADDLYCLVHASGDADAHLWGTGRNIDNFKLALQKDKLTKNWLCMGDADEHELTELQASIHNVLGSSQTPMGANEIANILDRPRNNVSMVMYRMFKLGRIKKVAYGKYAILEQMGQGGGVLLTDNKTNKDNKINLTNKTNKTSLNWESPGTNVEFEKQMKSPLRRG